MGIALLPLLPHEPSIVHTSLPPRASLLCTCCWSCTQLYRIGNDQLPCLDPRSQHSSTPNAVFRHWRACAYCSASLLWCDGHDDVVHRAVDIWYTWVRLFDTFLFEFFLLTFFCLLFFFLPPLGLLVSKSEVVDCSAAGLSTLTSKRRITRRKTVRLVFLW